MSVQNRRIITILLSASFLLLLPLIAMQFTTQINWNAFDFFVWAVLLFGAGGAIELGLRKVKGIKNRVAVVLTILAVFLFVWAELAIGILGTAFAGS